MNFILVFLDSLIAFVRRNPLTVLLIVVLGITAPALLRGLATLILYTILGIILLAFVLLFLLQRRMRRMQQQMEEQFGSRTDNTSYRWTNRRRYDGEVHVSRTSAAPEKRIANDVGDYVDFEESDN